MDLTLFYTHGTGFMGKLIVSRLHMTDTYNQFLPIIMSQLHDKCGPWGHIARMSIVGATPSHVIDLYLLPRAFNLD